MGFELRPGIRFARTAIPAATVILEVILIGFLVTAAPGWETVEMSLLRTVNLAHTAPLDTLALGVDWLFGPRVAVVLVLLGGAVVWGATRRPGLALRFLLIVTIPWLGTQAIKILVHRARPDIPSLPHALVLEPGGLSFPSGHTSFAACLLFGIIVIAAGQPWRPPFVAAATLVVLATAGSRIYLGVHYPTDVAASLVYSIAAVLLVDSCCTLLMTHWNHGRNAGRALPAHQGAPDAR